jgi:ketosteroid isomerase-like protein
MKQFTTKSAGKGGVWVLLVLLWVGAAVPVAAQKNKDKKKDSPATDSFGNSKPYMSMPDSQSIDRAIGEALGYWQIGDVDSLHKYYADDVTVVSGDWTPPVIGWDNYVKAYQAQRAQVSGGRMERTNTLIKVNGNFAWATYQFDFVATIGGKPAEFHGHTTLVLNKPADRWVITLNHSSVVESTVLNPVPVPPADAVQPRRP